MPNGGYYSNRLPSVSAAEDFELPENRYLSVPNQQSLSPNQFGNQGPAPEVPGPGGHLAQIEGLTDKYYSTWGKLNSYVKGLWQQGIDVTVPDFSAPDGQGTPHKVYQMLSGLMMSTANQLGNTLKKQETELPYRLTGQTTDQNVPNALLPEATTVIHKMINGTYHSPSEASRAYQSQVLPMVEALQNRPDANDPQIQHTIQALLAAHPSWVKAPQEYRNDIDEQKAKLKKIAGATREAGSLKRITALQMGNWDPEKTQESRNENGDIVLTNNENTGDVLGSNTIDVNGTPRNIKLVLDNWERRPDGSVWINFKNDPESDYKPEPINVSTMDPAKLTGLFMQSNVRMGQEQNLYNAMDILGWSDMTNNGALNIPAMLEEEGMKAFEERSKGLGERHQKAVAYDKQVSNVVDQLDEGIAQWKPGGNNAIKLTLPDGNKITIKKTRMSALPWNETKFYIEGGDEEPMTKDELRDKLKSMGYTPSTNPQPPKLTPEQQKKADDLLKSLK